MANVAHATSITCTRTLSPANSKEKDFIRNPLREVSDPSRSRLARLFARKANTVVPLLVGVSRLATPDQVVAVKKATNGLPNVYTHRISALSVACNLMP
jgi:hypothetical protein